MSKAKYSLPEFEQGTDTDILFKGVKRQGEDILTISRVYFDYFRRSRQEMQHLLQPEVHGTGAGGQGLVHVLTV